MRPLTREETVEVFGDPKNYVRGDGTVREAWPDKILGSYVTLPEPLALSWDRRRRCTRFRCHRLLTAIVRKTLADIYAVRPLWRSIGDWGGCYEWRRISGTKDRLSQHAWGIALDWDVRANPQGSAPVVNPNLVALMEEHGWFWGGHFTGSRVDGMHWEVSDTMLEQLEL